MQNLSQYWAHADALTLFVAYTLLIFSIVSWVIILLKSLQMLKIRKQLKQGIPSFWQAPSLNDSISILENQQFKYLSALPSAVATTLNDQPKGLYASANRETLLTQRIRQVLSEQTRQLEQGQVVLATIGSTAPFIGLLGTVWGIFHALTKIANTGSVAISQISGPVGESLIMTAFGLLVAVPAVIAYNFLGRSIRSSTKALEGFAADLYNYAQNLLKTNNR